jgi:hypothetical protein
VITESCSQCVSGVILEKLVVERAVVDFEAQFPFEPSGHGGFVFTNFHSVSGCQADPDIRRSDKAVTLGLAQIDISFVDPSNLEALRIALVKIMDVVDLDRFLRKCYHQSR